MFAVFDTVEFNRLPCSNNSMYDDAVYAGRCRYKLTMFGMCILIGLSLRLDTHIAYKYLHKTSSHITVSMREKISHSGL